MADNRLISFPDGSLLARFCRREKRFLVEVERCGERFWVHCNNSGSMLGLLRPGAEVLVSPAFGTNRRLSHTLELIRVGEVWVGVNTLVPNRLLKASWKAGVLPEVEGYSSFRSESKVGESRLDASLQGSRGSLWVETKNVTLVEDDIAYFPDAVTVRGQKHLKELMGLARNNLRVACFYLIQRVDARCFAPADFIDPVFSELFREAVDAGVEVWPYQARISPQGVALGRKLPVRG